MRPIIILNLIAKPYGKNFNNSKIKFKIYQIVPKKYPDILLIFSQNPEMGFIKLSDSKLKIPPNGAAIR